jgi:hypothetical protein
VPPILSMKWTPTTIQNLAEIRDELGGHFGRAWRFLVPGSHGHLASIYAVHRDGSTRPKTYRTGGEPTNAPLPACGA